MVFGGSVAITDYASYVYNYTKGQYPYKIPISALGDAQQYVPLWEYGVGIPASQEYQLIHTCGDTAGTIETITPSNYVAGLDSNGNSYMVITGFNESTTAQCFVIAAELDDQLWFSQEYTLDGCDTGLNYIYSCYGNLDPQISYDSEGIYFGQSQGSTVGDANVIYQHFVLMRTVDLTINGIRNEFKQGRTRTFRTESATLYQFWGDLVPDWYIKAVDAVFKRGEVQIGQYPTVYSFPVTANEDTFYLVESTPYEKVNDCPAAWKPTAILRENFYNSFSCEPNPCDFISQDEGGGGGGTQPCCNPQVIGATVEPNGEGGQTVCVNFAACTPAPANGYTVLYRIIGSGGAYTVADSGYSGSPACFGTLDPDGTQYEGYIYSDCDGVFGSQIYWTTGGSQEISITHTPCAADHTDFTVNGTQPGDTVTFHITFSGFITRVSGTFMGAQYSVFYPGGSFDDNTPCIFTTSSGFFLSSPQVDLVYTATGDGTDVIAVNANVINALAGSSVVTITITDVNGVPQNVQDSGCVGNSGQGGSCPFIS